ncbi:hypothetical protein GCM10009749_16160 [Agromyces neolithicus]|uniref:CHAP domain-containing protein n=1 Tax=Agromyces neolithicus TaxID=269420 RepID=A0ABN2M3S4_9MICO
MVALTCSTAILGVSAFGAVAAAADDAGSPVAARPGIDPAAAAYADEIVSVIDAVDDAPIVTSGLSTAAVPFTGGTQVTVNGEGLDEVDSVTVAGVPATIVTAEDDAVTFAVPAVSADSIGTAQVRLAAAGAPVAIASADAAVVAGASVPQTTTTDLNGIVEASTRAIPHALTLTYTSNPAIDAQVGYVLTHWNSYNSSEYTVLSGVDCANFASQSLIERGWKMDGGWYYDRATGAMSPSWSSSTAMRDWLMSRPDLATPLDDSQRGLVKVGDIAQFDWNSSGDRDHTAIVTRVEHTDSGTRVWVGSHTKDVDYWNVDEAIANGGGYVTYFSLR